LLGSVCVIDKYLDLTFCGMTIERNCSHSSSSRSSSQYSQSGSGGKPNPLPGNISPSSSSLIYPSLTLLGLAILVASQMFVF